MQNQVTPAEQQQPRLELSLNAEDGSLQTTPLLTVLLASTDGLYTDLYDMAHGELDVTTTAQGAATDDGGNEYDMEEQDGGSVQKKERMSNLSFAQRRHELAWRLAQHSRGLTHVAALTAAAASTDLANSTRVSSKALQRARSAWVQADEAQDALYFFHAQLFPARRSPHDIYGALDVMLRGTWIDLPEDIRLVIDRYQTSRENAWSSSELADRWHLAVRDKLLRGEVGWMRLRGIESLWKASLSGGVVHLTHGTEKLIGNQSVFPMEAHVTVFSTAVPAEWTLLSIEVRAQAKTGESSHQLDTTNRQRYDLHRLCALAMAREERQAREAKQQSSTDDDEDDDSTEFVHIARPLHRLFQVAHRFGLSWQLEILSAQAQALRRGVWASGESNPIVVTPVQFFETGDILGVVSISFWSVDDQYGPPRIGDLSLTNQGGTGGLDPPVTNQLTLSVRAEAELGMRVSLSGGESIMVSMNEQLHVRLAITNLLEATSSPFGLSASDALLAATSLCAERKCHSIVEALEPRNGASLLPAWMHLHVERGSIGVSASLCYGANGLHEKASSSSVVLFRLACDARTGDFVPTFGRSLWLLRYLACNDICASEAASLQIAKLAQNRRKGGSANITGRFVRDSFEGLSRSMNALGQKTGVGGPWSDSDEMSASLRHRAIQVACSDVRVSLVTCCAVAAIYGLTASALGIASGSSACPDMAGGNFEAGDDASFVPAPPVSVVLDQNVVQTDSVSNEGEKKKNAFLERDLFAVGCSANDQGMKLHGARIKVHLETPYSAPRRVQFVPVVLQSTPEDATSLERELNHLSKRRKLGDDTSTNNSLADEVEKLALIFSKTLERFDYSGNLDE